MTDTRLTEEEIALITDRARDDSKAADYVDLERAEVIDAAEEYRQHVNSLLADRRVLVEALRRAEAVGRIWKMRTQNLCWSKTDHDMDNDLPGCLCADPTPKEIDAEVRRGG